MKQILYKGTTLVFLFIAFGVNAQKQAKTFTETFNVNKDAVLDINTSNADIVFETWNKDQIQVETVLEIEGMSAKEAEEYFKRNEVKVIGNSKKVEVSTGGGGLFSNNFNFNYNLPTVIRSNNVQLPQVINSIKNLTFEVDSLRIITPPNFMSYNTPNFDYERYEKEGEKYLAKWQKKFEKEFDEKKVKELEEWAKKMEKNSEALKKEAKVIEKKSRELALKHKALAKKNHKIYIQNSKNNVNHQGNDNIFYFSSDGEDKHIKVKKTIKIKMPKSATIKMNVRHGEVKLAENTRNIKANLNYSSLLASTIDGEDTYVTASYSPVSVSQWNLGQLKADYSDDVHLKTVKDLKLSSVSSNIEIGELLKTAFVQNDFGKIIINNISNDFSTLDVSLQNGELECDLPKTSYSVYVKGTSSKLTTPLNMKLNKTKNQNTIVNKGNVGSKNSNKSITIASKYSEVVLK